MSGIAGVCNLDGGPIDSALLERMTAAIAHRGTDGVHHWIDGPVGMGHCMLQTTPESVYERQPLTDESGNLCLTMDGRVDNREEIIAALKSKGVRLRDDTDAEIVLRAYECWGTECPARIIGDFSLAIWDKRQRQLFCARDVGGNKPFVYHWNGRRLLFSSELHGLFEDAATPREPNEGMIGEYLAVNITHTEETLYKDILRLPPAHYLMVRNGQVTKHRYWDIDFGKEIHYRSDDEYAEHFTQVFKECVRCCLRSHRPVGAYLSGGLDSSSVVSMAQTIYREGSAEDRGFETFSIAYPGLPCDETPYIRAMEQRWNLRANYMPLEEPDINHLRYQVSFYKDICDYPNGSQLDTIRRSAREKGFRVLLTGQGGDERLDGSLYYLAEFAGKGQLIALLTELRRQKIELTSKAGLSDLYHYAFVPLLPPAIRSAKQRLKFGKGKSQSPTSCIDGDYAKRIGLRKRLGLDPAKLILSSKQWLKAFSNHSGNSHGMELEDRAAAQFGIEQRHPFGDRRMIELSFALPENQRRRKDQKFVLREAMRGLLPEIIRRRTDKADFSETLFRTVRCLSEQPGVVASDLHQRGWVDLGRTRAMSEELVELHDAGDDNYILRVWPLWMACALELWAASAILGRNALRPSKMADFELATT